MLNLTAAVSHRTHLLIILSSFSFFLFFLSSFLLSSSSISSVKDRPKVLPWKEANPLAMCTICGTSSYTAAIQLFIFISNIGAAGSEAAIGVLYAMSFYSKNGPKCKCDIRYKLFSFICSSIKASKHITNHFF